MVCGVASAFEVGLESGNIIGRSQVWVMCFSISVVKWPWQPEEPISVVG